MKFLINQEDLELQKPFVTLFVSKRMKEVFNKKIAKIMLGKKGNTGA